ncbi:MAG TPA: zinc ribbon domain-containing protein [Thermoplasmata archaeon]|nr:zinc ribbon domain-containing protein [Thermoplasmata archaeon]
MPFRGEVDRGTEADGRSSVDYCVGCYPNGTFTEPNLTMARMIENARKQMQAEGFPEGIIAQNARKIPTFKRWKSTRT